MLYGDIVNELGWRALFEPEPNLQNYFYYLYYWYLWNNWPPTTSTAGGGF